MKYGIYYAYWEKEWEADYAYYVDKAVKLGFDILEVGAKPLPEYTPHQIANLRSCAKGNGITLTVGYGPSFDHNMGSKDPAVRANAAEWFKRLFDVMGQLDIHKIGGALYSYWPIDFSKPVYKEDDWKYSAEGTRMVPGQGRMPWREIGEALRSIHYEGDVIMEPFVNRGGQVEKDIHIWHDLKPDITEAQLDQDAQNALRFERYMFEQMM